MFESILAATDGSPSSDKAVRLAADLAGLYGAQLTLVHVVESGKLSNELRHMAEVEHLVDAPAAPAAPATGELPAMLSDRLLHENITRAAHAIGSRLLADAAHRAGAAREPETRLEEGDPAAQILACARKLGTDLLVVGSRGRSGVKSALLGSVSHRVSQAAPCTVITVK